MEQNQQSRSLSSFRQSAREKLRGHYTGPVLATLIFMLVSGISSALSGENASLASALVSLLISLLVVPVMEVGIEKAMLGLVRGDTDDYLARVFSAFKEYGRNLGVGLLKTVYIFLWTLLLIIPGIVKSYAYALSYFISKDHPELDADECIDLSKEMMKGHKMDLFLLDLSYIGWYLLGILTLGILWLWIIPRQYAAHAEFYEFLKSQREPQTDDKATYEEGVNFNTL